MGFGNKDISPEKRLVSELWEEIKLILADTSDKIALNRHIEEAYNRGASCEEIRRVYEENLPYYKKKPDDEIARIRAVLSTPTPRKEKRIFFFVAVLVVAIVAILLSLPRSIRYERVLVGGLAFGLPQMFSPVDSGDEDMIAFRRYEYESETGSYDNRRWTTYCLDIYVFQEMNVEQATAYLGIGERWEIVRDISYGAHNGIRADITVMPFGNTVPQWFIFEKEGKTAAVFLDNEALFKSEIGKIID